MFDPATARRIAAAAAGVAALMCGWLVVLHVRMVLSPAPQEMREGAIVWITRLLLEGRNPYALSELPAGTNAYGIVYHLVVLPFARLFGNGYTVHRAVSGAAIAGSCALLYRMSRHRGADALLSAVGVMLFYASSLYFVAPLARPDSVGVFFCIASLSLLFDRDALADVPWRDFGFGLFCAMLALLTKIYLAFPPFLFALYVLLFVSPKRGLIYGATAVVLSTALLWSMTLFFPAYISVSVIDNINSSTYYDIEHMQRQTLDWLVFSLPTTAGVLLVLVQSVRTGSVMRMVRTAPSPFAFATLVNTVVFFGLFAGHPGAHMTYLFHLVSPLLIMALLPTLSSRHWARAIVIAALPVAFALNAHYFPLTFGRFRDAETTFARITGDINAHTNVLGSTEVAGPLALAGRPVFDSGHSQYFASAATDHSWPGFVPARLLQARWDSFIGEINDGIEHERFDLIIRSRRPGLLPQESIKAHYVRVATYDVDFPWGAQRWPVDLWEPREPRP